MGSEPQVVMEHLAGRAGGLPGVRVDALDVTVLLGGPSSERDVSIMSGRAVAEAMERRGHKVTMADISPEDDSALDRKGVDVVFIALHGTFGEDGQVQRLCRRRGITHVGSGPLASALAMDKDASKRLFRRAGLTTPDWVVIDGSMRPSVRAGLLEKIPPPCVLKPIDGGSSVDVIIARDRGGRSAALEKLLAVHERVMVETFVSGREMTVGIFADRPLPVIEIRAAREFYDKFAKYEDDATEYVFDTQLPRPVMDRLQAAALAAHNALGCEDFSRVDFILLDERIPCVLEVNTIPGFTSHSLLPKAAAAAGIGFDQLCDRIVGLAVERARG